MLALVGDRERPAEGIGMSRRIAATPPLVGPDAVVDWLGRVQGTGGMRVVDAGKWP
jgi:hypothetical protein